MTTEKPDATMAEPTAQAAVPAASSANVFTAPQAGVKRLAGVAGMEAEQEGLPADMPGWFTGAMDHITSKLSSTLTPVTQEVQVLRTDVDGLKADVAKLKDQAASGATSWAAPSTWGPGSGTRTPAGSTVGASSAVPAAALQVQPLLKIRNFSEFGKWKECGVDRPHATKLMIALTNLLPAELRGEILPFELMGPLNYEIRVPLARAGILAEVRKTWQTALKSPEMHFNGRELYVVPERNEQEKPRYSLMGKTKAVFENWEVDAVKDTEWEFKYYWHPNWKIVVVESGREWLIARMSESGIWNFDAKNLKHYTNWTPTEVTAQL